LSFSGAAAHDILELAIYVLGDQFGILVKYPTQETAIDGPTRVFSLPVSPLPYHYHEEKPYTSPRPCVCNGVKRPLYLAFRQR